MKRNLLALVLLLPLVGCNAYEVETEEVSARVLTKGEVETFDLGAAVLAYVSAKCVSCDDGSALLWGVTAGTAAADGCKIPLMVEEEPIVLDAPNRFCRELDENDTVTLTKRTYTYLDRETGEIHRTQVKYRWKR